MALFHCMVRHGTVRYGSLLGGFPLGTVPGTWYFFSTTSAEVPSDLYRYQNVTCKLCWSLIGRRESSLLRQWTCDTRPSSTARPARFKSAQPAKERTQHLFQQTHLFASTTNYLFHCLLRKNRRSSRWKPRSGSVRAWWRDAEGKSLMYTVPSTNPLVNMTKGAVKINLHCLSFLSFIQKIHKIPTYHWSKTIESGEKISWWNKCFHYFMLATIIGTQLLQRPFPRVTALSFLL